MDSSDGSFNCEMFQLKQCSSLGMPSEPLIRHQGGHDACSVGSSAQLNEQGQDMSSLRPLSAAEDDDVATDWDAGFEDCAGISAPLYRVVESVFDMPAQKFFRRQVGKGIVRLLRLLLRKLL